MINGKCNNITINIECIIKEEKENIYIKWSVIRKKILTLKTVFKNNICMQVCSCSVCVCACVRVVCICLNFCCF